MKCDIDNKDCPYYRNGKCIFHKVKPKMIAIDLDGTLLEFDKWRGHNHFGKPIESGFWGEFLYGDNSIVMHPRDALREIKKRGWVIIIWTTRSNIDKIKEVLDKYEIPYDYINENPLQPPGLSNKIYADVYIDDNAIRFWK